MRHHIYGHTEAADVLKNKNMIEKRHRDRDSGSEVLSKSIHQKLKPNIFTQEIMAWESLLTPCFVFQIKVYCMQKNRLNNTVSTQQVIYLSEFMGFRYPPRSVKNRPTKPNRKYLSSLKEYPKNLDPFIDCCIASVLQSRFFCIYNKISRAISM